MMTISVEDIKTIEKLYYQDKECEIISSGLWPQINSILSDSTQSQWRSVFLQVQNILPSLLSSHEKVFLLNLGVIATEQEHHRVNRLSLLQFWNQIPERFEDPWIRSYWFFHQAMSCFFDAFLEESEMRFLECLALSKQNKDDILKMRVLFRLGLIKRDQEKFSQASEYFYIAKTLAVKTQNEFYERKIQAQLVKLGFEKSGPIDALLDFEVELCKAIEGKEWEVARQNVLKIELSRRKNKISKHISDVRHLTSLCYLGLKKNRLASLFLSRVTDPVNRNDYFRLKEKLFGLTKIDDQEWSFQRKVLGLSELIVQTGLNDVKKIRIHGIWLNQIKDRDVQLLLTVLVRQGSLNKTEIAKRIWNLDFDPVIHDNKIYKLIYRARKILGTNDLFQNEYGGIYKIDPRYLKGA